MMGCPMEELCRAVSEALAPVAHREVSWDIAKLEKRIRDYCRKAAKTLEFNTKSWVALVDDYANYVYASIFQSLGDRDWLQQIDFVMVLDAGIKDAFPERIWAPVPRDDFERAVLTAHDNAFELHRFLPMAHILVKEHAPDPGKARKKVYDAVVEGRKKAMCTCGLAEDPNTVKAFLSIWTDATLSQLRRDTGGDAAGALPEAAAARLFHALLEAGALPVPLTSQHGPPPARWPFVEYATRAAYVAHSGLSAQGPRGRGRGGALGAAAAAAAAPADVPPPEPGGGAAAAGMAAGAAEGVATGEAASAPATGEAAGDGPGAAGSPPLGGGGGAAPVSGATAAVGSAGGGSGGAAGGGRSDGPAGAADPTGADAGQEAAERDLAQEWAQIHNAPDASAGACEAGSADATEASGSPLGGGDEESARDCKRQRVE